VFHLNVAHPTTLTLIQSEWSRCLARGPVTSSDIKFDFHGEESPLPNSFGYSLSSQLTMRAIEQHSGRHLMFHAAGLADDRGRVVALVGPSGTGKTTAAHILASHGWGYVTDETVAIDDDGRVIPYPKPLSLVDDPAHSGRKSQHSPDDLGLGPTPEDPVIARLVLLERVRERHIEPELTDVPLLDALLDLVPHTSALARLSTPLQRLCRLVDRVGGVHRLIYSDVKSTDPLLAALMSDEDFSTEPKWEAIQPAPPARPEPGVLTCGTFLDAVRVGGEGLVLVDRTPVRLSAVGLTLWRRARTGATDQELLAAAVAEHGDHPGAATLLEEAVETMVTASLLVRN